MTTELAPLNGSSTAPSTTMSLYTIEKDLKMAETLLRSGFLPQHIKTPYQCYAIMLRGRELNLPPMSSVSNIYIVNGKTALEGQLMMALIHRSGFLEDMKVEDDGMKCTVTMKRRGQATAHTASFSMQDAADFVTYEKQKEIRLIDKHAWKSQPKVMRQWKALTQCARVLFPDVLQGCYAAEEFGYTVEQDPDLGPVMKDGNDVVGFSASIEDEFNRLSDELRAMGEQKKLPSSEDLASWVAVNGEILGKMDAKRKPILLRMYKEIAAKVKPAENVGGLAPAVTATEEAVQQ